MCFLDITYVSVVTVNGSSRRCHGRRGSARALLWLAISSSQKLSVTITGNQDDFTIQTDDFTIQTELSLCFDLHRFEGVWPFKDVFVWLAVSLLSWLNLLFISCS